jgi:tRNA U34 2-thiouridine synthase MnmA/TrmU
VKVFTGVRLLTSKDVVKDQTFFLSQISQNALKHTMFPVGNLMKQDVRQIAQKNALERIVRKKESMGICFIGNRHFQDFISQVNCIVILYYFITSIFQ